MGQYFKFVNPDREEWIELPGAMKLIERVTDGAAMSIVGYMLFDGPCDGTVLTRNEHYPGIDEVEMQREVDEFIEGEIDMQDSFDGDITTVYYDDDAAEWNRDKIRPVVVAGYEISDAMEYCGRWAGEDVRLAGDYADNGLYGEAKQKCQLQRADGTVFTANKGTGPVEDKEPGDDTSGRVSFNFGDDVTRGDVMLVNDPATNEQIFAEYIGVAEQQWTNITDDMLAEMRHVVGDSWFTDTIASRYRHRDFDEVDTKRR
jgi:hypothetical protein